MGERLFVSSHTVKTQAYSVYRKLGVSSRSEAVARVHELSLDASEPAVNQKRTAGKRNRLNG
jgi:Bacterial regulatory proteins, luxR family